MPNFIPVDFDPFAGSKEIEKITFTNEPQREIWLSCIIGGDEANLSYNESVSLKITGDLNIESFKNAVDDLVLRHEALRATVSPNGETLIIYKEFPLEHSYIDISHVKGAQKKSEFDAYVKAEMANPLDLINGPLFRVFLHKTGESEYYFTIIKHHIIGDGWSTGIMLEDLSKMYNAYSKGDSITLDTASQISDYASAQASFKSTKEYQQTEDYWLNLYKDNVPLVDLPTDHPRVSPRTYGGNRIDSPLSKAMVDQLKAVGAKAGSSLVTTLLAAFEVFIYQETHQRDIVIGLPSSGQAASGLTSVVGHCVNLLPLKTYVDPTLPFTEYLKRRKGEVLDAYDHQRFTFGELIKKLYIPRDASRITLVPVMFNIDMGMDNSVAFDGLDFKLISNPRAYESFELYLNATGSKDGIILEWSYNTGLFDAETIHKFHSHYYAILEQIITNAGITIADLVGEEEVKINPNPATEIFIPKEQTAIALFNETAKQYFNKTAVNFNNQSLTYQQLHDKADQFAAFLISKNIAAGDIVALALERSMEMLVCLLGVLKAGGIYLPIDPEYPLERVEFMLKDSEAKLLLTSVKYKNWYRSQSTEIVIDEVWPELVQYKEPVLSRQIDGDDLAYILYTSGSTGQPKGVKISHLNLVNLLLNMQVKPGIQDTDKLLAITTISFDIAGLELYLPLISGAEIVIADAEAIKDGRLLLDIIENKGITIMQGTPSTWQMLLDSGWQKRYQLKAFSGGEQLSKDLAQELLNYCTELWNMYAPTETTIYSTVKQITQKDKQITIGVPIANTTVYIMDEAGKPLPANHPGEIYIGGTGVSQGYLNRPELTDEKFVNNPFIPNSTAKLYRTGDLGKILTNGEIQCLGRIDHQVKIRGHRIELGEIESVIGKQQNIKQAVVIAREDSPMDKRLVAYITLDDDDSKTGNPSWKDRWDTLYETGAENKQLENGSDQNIDGTLLEQLSNSAELTIQAAEWLQTTVDRIKELGSKRIYEIGSGAGQILFELAPGIDYYMATDYAPAAITNINNRLKIDPEKWKHVHASAAPADDFSAIGDTSVDLVLINSVVQYFPNANYLIQVIRQAIGAIKQGGCIFVGDMQGKNSLEMYHAMDHYPRALETTTVGLFKDVVENRVRIEEEFVADPAFFHLLPKLFPEITGVDIQLRKGQASNETTKYHYDIWLYISTPVETAKTQISRNWNDLNSITQLEQLLNSDLAKVVEVKNILNVRTAKDHKLMQLLNSATPDTKLATIKTEIEKVSEGLHPDLFWVIGDKLNYDSHVRWTSDGADGLFDVVYIPKSDKLLLPEYSVSGKSAHDIYDFSRAPLYKNEVNVSPEMIQNWKETLADVLPAYMVPDDFVALKSFPLTPNAKIDRKALPKPQAKQATNKTAESRPLTEAEDLVMKIWSETLGLPNLNPTDDFFQLGGHSLLAVKVMVAIEKKTGVRLPIATLFSHSTIEKLASRLSGDEPTKNWDALVPIKATGKKVPLFLIHGGGLNILLFKSISEYFDKEQPIYGIQALGFNHETDVPSTIEEIAKRYIDDMLDVNPHGPYAIAGYSLGGFIAFEMAGQLKAMGKEVSFLGIMDTYAGNNHHVDSKAAHLAKKVIRQFRKVPFFVKSFIHSPKEAFEYQYIIWERKLHGLLSNEVLIPKDTFNDYEVEIYKKYSIALDAYELSPLDIKMSLFRVEKRLYYLDDLIYLGWDKFALQGVDVQPVPGDHKTFLYWPNSEKFAGIIQKVLDKL